MDANVATANIVDFGEKIHSIDVLVHDKNVVNLDMKDVFRISDVLSSIWENSKVMEKDCHKNRFVLEGISSILNKSCELFSDIEKLEEAGVHEDLFILQQLHSLSSKADQLDLQFVFLSPDEIASHLDGFYKSINEIYSKKSYNKLLIKRLMKDCLKKINHLHFRLMFPITEELSEFSYQNTFSRKMLDIASKHDENNAKGIKSYIASLQYASFVAESFLFDDIEKAINLFDQLHPYVQKQVNQNIWKLSGTTYADLNTKLVSNHKLSKGMIAIAIMKYVSSVIVF
jgi:hypothetical protein